MPWDKTSFRERHNKKLSDAKATQAVKIANAVLERTGNEASAIRIANAAVKHGKRLRSR